MSRTALPQQPPIFPQEAEDYARQALARSRVATAGLPVIRDQRYGAHPQQTLDVYPAHPAHRAGAPVLVFAHGGAWTNGYKEWMGLMAPALVQQGIMLVSIDYRLAPTHRYTDMVEDCLSALVWVRANVAAYGGNPDCLAVGGHSAGGHITMLTVWQPRRLAAAGIDPTVIQACFPLCAALDIRYPNATAGSGEARTHTMLLDDPTEAADASPVYHLHPATPSTLLAYASDDLPRVTQGNLVAARRMAELGVDHEIMPLPGDHFSVALDLESPKAAWIQAVVSRIQKVGVGGSHSIIS